MIFGTIYIFWLGLHWLRQAQPPGGSRLQGPGFDKLSLRCLSQPKTQFNLYTLPYTLPLYTYTPKYLYTFIPLYLYTCTPICLYTYTPIYLYTITPLLPTTRCLPISPAPSCS